MFYRPATPSGSLSRNLIGGLRLGGALGVALVTGCNASAAYVAPDASVLLAPISKQAVSLSKSLATVHRMLGYDRTALEFEPPNNIAARLANDVLSRAANYGLAPSAITPSVEGGVTLVFLAGDRSAALECYNGGDILAVRSERDGTPTVWTVGASADEYDVDASLDLIKSFLYT